MDVGVVRRGIDLYELLTCEGEKPLTTLVVLLSEVPLGLSEDADSAELLGAASEAEALVFSAAGMAICGVDSHAFLG
jgi:hypothetical protein